MNLNEYFKNIRIGEMFDSYLVPRIRCKDGFSVSVQASDMHYCSPRENSVFYWEVEVGFPSEVCPALLRYAEDIDQPTDTVYGYVPIEIVEAIIDEHGGVA